MEEVEEVEKEQLSASNSRFGAFIQKRVILPQWLSGAVELEKPTEGTES